MFIFKKGKIYISWNNKNFELRDVFENYEIKHILKKELGTTNNLKKIIKEKKYNEKEFFAIFEKYRNPIDYKDGVYSLQSKGKYNCIYLYKNDNAIGSCQFEFCDINEKNIAFMHIDLFDCYIGKGYGKHFYDLVEKYLSEKGYELYPAPILSQKAYNFWKKRDSNKLQGYAYDEQYEEYTKNYFKQNSLTFSV